MKKIILSIVLLMYLTACAEMGYHYDEGEQGHAAMMNAMRYADQQWGTNSQYNREPAAFKYEPVESRCRTVPVIDPQTGRVYSYKTECN